MDKLIILVMYQVPGLQQNDGLATMCPPLLWIRQGSQRDMHEENQSENAPLFSDDSFYGSLCGLVLSGGLWWYQFRHSAKTSTHKKQQVKIRRNKMAAAETTGEIAAKTKKHKNAVVAKKNTKLPSRRWVNIRGAKGRK